MRLAPGGDPVYILLRPYCAFALAIQNAAKYFALYGGDDGARTRDLCRDRSRMLLNLKHFMSADG